MPTVYKEIKDNYTGMINGLTETWIHWLQDQGIPKISADDLMHSHYMDVTEDGLTDQQIKFVETFSRLWDLMEDIEND